MRTTFTAVAAAVVFAVCGAARAATTTTLTFEGVTSFASIGGYYGGGTDAAGAAGPDFGVAFTDAALALSNDALGPYFSNAPSPGTVLFATDSTATMNVASGFTGELSFWYSAASSALDVVTIHAGLDGTGALLGAISLSRNAQLGGCSDSPFCNFQRISLSFAGLGRSVTFGGNAGNVAFDDVTISAVPEPASALLMALGAGGLLLAGRRRHSP